MSRSLLILLLVTGIAHAEDPKPKWPQDKGITFVLGPLYKDGYINFSRALNEHLSKGIQPETNFMVDIINALGPKPEGAALPAKYYALLGIKEPPKQGNYIVNLESYIRDNVLKPGDPMDFKPYLEQQYKAQATPWTGKEYPVILGWMASNAKPLDRIVAAVSKQDYYNPLVASDGEDGPGMLLGALLPMVQKCREVANLLCTRAMFRLKAGDREAAWRDLLACQRLGRHISQGATSIEGLVGIAISSMSTKAVLTYLENTDLTVKELRTHLADLCKIPKMASLAEKIDICERFMYLDSIQSIRRDINRKTLGGQFPNPPANLELDWPAALKAGNQLYTRMANACRKDTRAERRAAIKEIFDEIEVLRKKTAAIKEEDRPKGPELAKFLALQINNVLIGLLCPALDKLQNAFDRAEQMSSNLQIAFALAAYKQEHAKYPAKLADLAPRYLPKVPLDVFTGKEMTYKLTEKGYLLYSLGENGKDDGGQWLDERPKGDDIRVRMPSNN